MDLTKLTGEHSELVQLAGEQRQLYLEYLRRQIIDNDRIDILATEVLGLQMKPFHLAMLKFQFQHKDNLQLVGRGFGKSTMCTDVKAIHYLIKYPKARIVIASKTLKQAQSRLKSIKSYLEGCELLIELFGEFKSKEFKDDLVWNQTKIEISQRHDPKNANTPGARPNDATESIVCVGAKGSVAGAHFDIEFSDDLIDKTNSDTETTREEVNDWYNGTFTPMLDPPDINIPFRGDRNRVGTRYHYLDQYGRWIKNAKKLEAKGLPHMAVNIVPALHPETGQSPWPERFSVEYLARKREDIGTIAFNAQYLNDISMQEGELFDYDACIPVPMSEIKPFMKKLNFYIGVDLAISEKAAADDFAIVVLGKYGRGKEEKFYVVDSFNGKLRFAAQVRKIKEIHDKWDAEGGGVKKIGVETVAYQLALFQQLQDSYPELKKKFKKIKPGTGDDKVNRANRLTVFFERKQVMFATEMIKKPGEASASTDAIAWKLIEQLVLFPGGDHDDLFDAFDHAMTVARKKTRRAAREEIPLF